MFATNVTGAMLMAREAAKHFIKRQRGNIVNIASTAAIFGRSTDRQLAYYCQQVRASRHVLRCWRAELRQRHNIRVVSGEPK